MSDIQKFSKPPKAKWLSCHVRALTNKSSKGHLNSEGYKVVWITNYQLFIRLSYSSIRVFFKFGREEDRWKSEAVWAGYDCWACIPCCFTEVCLQLVSVLSDQCLWPIILLHIVIIIPKSKKLKDSPWWALISPRMWQKSFGSDSGLTAFRKWGSVMTAHQNLR